jgi:hypothetical protein
MLAGNQVPGQIINHKIIWRQCWIWLDENMPAVGVLRFQVGYVGCFWLHNPPADREIQNGQAPFSAKIPV